MLCVNCKKKRTFATEGGNENRNHEAGKCKGTGAVPDPAREDTHNSENTFRGGRQLRYKNRSSKSCIINSCREETRGRAISVRVHTPYQLAFNSRMGARLRVTCV